MKPLGATLMGKAIVLFRTGTGIAALIDRCPHRNVPLSHGSVCDGAITCPYHGWTFDAHGQCVMVPGVDEAPDIAAERVHTANRHGLIWACLADDAPEFPELPRELEDRGLDRFWWPLKPREARALDALENHLDPMHPHFLHPNLVRKTGERLPVPVTVQTTSFGGQARYEEAHLPQTFLPRLIEGKRVSSTGRYFAPLTGQVSFENSRGLTIAITVVFSPVAENLTRPYAHFATPKGAIPAWLKNRLITAFHRPVLAQDAAVLKQQSRNIDRFGEANFAVGPADILGPIIWQRVHGKVPDSEEKRLQLHL